MEQLWVRGPRSMVGIRANPAWGGGAEVVSELGGGEPVAAPQLLDLPGELLSRVLSRLDGPCFATSLPQPTQHSRHALPGHPPPLTHITVHALCF